MYYETPVLNIMGRELATFDDFQKTLSQLGYNSGSVLIRLSFRKTDQTLFEAMGQISQFFSEVEAEAKKTDQAPPVVEETAKPAAVEKTPEPAAPKKRPSLLQSQISRITNKAVERQRKSRRVWLSQQRKPWILISQKRQTLCSRRLLSDKELEAQRQAEEARLAAVTKVSMKVRFPDNTSAQWTFGHEATGATLYQAVRSVMAHSTQAFRLVIPGSKVVIKDEDSPKNRLIHDYKLTRSVLLSLVWNDSVPADVRKKPFLKGSVAQKAMDVTGDGKEEQQPAASSSKPEKREGSGDGSVAKKLPKWLKLPGKK
ncbi:UBX domain-containing protein [Colletotrichum tofieldiae]|nr:UBX domain-containing protein [Colletotrichum tofieldiae]